MNEEGLCVCVRVFLGLGEMSFRGRGRGRGVRFGGPPGILPRDEDGNVVIPKKQEGPPHLYPVCVCVRVHFDFFEGNFLLLTSFWNSHCATWFLLLRN